MSFKKRFQPFIERRGLLKVIYVATCDENGHPNCAPRLIIDIDEPDKIFYVDFKSSQSYANMCRTGRVSLAFMDEQDFIGFKLNGFSEAIHPGEEFERLKKTWAKIANSYHAERIIERIKGIISGRVGEIPLTDDYVFVKFNATKIKEGIHRLSNRHPISKIASLQMQIDELEKAAERHKKAEEV